MVAAPPPGVRRYQRWAISAAIEILLPSAKVAVAVENLSLGGALLATTDEQQAKLIVGRVIDIAFFDPALRESAGVTARATVVRHGAGATALRWTEVTPKLLSDLRDLLKRARARK